MRDQRFQVYVDQLRDGHTAQINEILEPEFLEVQERELQFIKPISLKGQAYLAGDGLVLNLAIKAVGTIPCLVCNEPVEVDIIIDKLYHMQPLDEIKGAVFDFKTIVREAILLEVPAFAECSQGNCSKRKEIQKYLKKSEETNEEGYHPFANL